MTTKEAIQAQLSRLNENDLEELYRLIEQFILLKEAGQSLTLMERLRDIQIDGPEDFASNLDLYLSGGKSAGAHPR